jgi:hypothetical protein
MSQAAPRHAPARRHPYALMKKLLDEERGGVYGAIAAAADSREQPYATDAATRALRASLRAKHGVGGLR